MGFFSELPTSQRGRKIRSRGIRKRWMDGLWATRSGEQRGNFKQVPCLSNSFGVDGISAKIKTNSVFKEIKDKLTRMRHAISLQHKSGESSASKNHGQPTLYVRLHIFVMVVDHGQFLLWESAVLKFPLNQPKWPSNFTIGRSINPRTTQKPQAQCDTLLIYLYRKVWGPFGLFRGRQDKTRQIYLYL